MDVLLESGKGESGSVVGVRVWSVERIFKGLAADMLAIPRIQQRPSAIRCLLPGPGRDERIM